MKPRSIALVLLCSLFALSPAQDDGFVIVTACDQTYFKQLLNLIGSIHRVNFNELEEIAVYDIGLLSEQKEQLARMQKVNLYDVEMTNPELLTPKVMDDQGKTVPGLYAWKPVVIKQALERHEVILYLDSGNTVLKPLNNLFTHIRQNGYFLISVYHSVRWGTISYVIHQLDLGAPERTHVLDKISISANIIGCSRAVYDSFVKPVYELTKDMRFFTDDGSAGGFGRCRYDQTLWSVYAYLNNMTIKTPSWSMLQVDGRDIPFHSNCFYQQANVDSSYWLNPMTTIYQSRGDYDLLIGAQYVGLPLGIAGKPYFQDSIYYK